MSMRAGVGIPTRKEQDACHGQRCAGCSFPRKTAAARIARREMAIGVCAYRTPHTCARSAHESFDGEERAADLERRGQTLQRFGEVLFGHVVLVPEAMGDGAVIERTGVHVRAFR